MLLWCIIFLVINSLIIISLLLYVIRTINEFVDWEKIQREGEPLQPESYLSKPGEIYLSHVR